MEKQGKVLKSAACKQGETRMSKNLTKSYKTWSTDRLWANAAGQRHKHTGSHCRSRHRVHTSSLHIHCLPHVFYLPSLSQHCNHKLSSQRQEFLPSEQRPLFPILSPTPVVRSQTFLSLLTWDLYSFSSFLAPPAFPSISFCLRPFLSAPKDRVDLKLGSRLRWKSLEVRLTCHQTLAVWTVPTFSSLHGMQTQKAVPVRMGKNHHENASSQHTNITPW